MWVCYDNYIHGIPIMKVMHFVYNVYITMFLSIKP